MKSLRDTSGSAVLAALLVAILMSSIAGLYLRSVTQEVQNSHRTRLMLETVNVAEMGAEEAIYALLYGDWSTWQGGTYGYSRQMSIVMGSETRTVRTYIDLVDPDAPKIVTEATITHPMGIKAVKQLRIDLDRRGLFSNGLTSRNGVTMTGNNTAVDSYNSADGPYSTSTNRNDRGSVASTSVAVASVDIQNADIFGYVATGGGQPKVGSNGSVTGWDTPGGTKVDPKRVSMDFYAEFPPISDPSLSSPYTSSGSTMGFPAVSTEYHLSSLTIGSGNLVLVEGDVTLVVDGDIDIKGELRVETGAQLTIYAEGDVMVGGNGMTNLTNQPANLVMFATADEGTGQQIKLHGNGAMAGAVYAPFADVDMKGGGSSGVMYGAVVGNVITINGNYEFHYDEALDDYGTNGKFSLVGWRELNAASSRYSDVLALRNTGL